MPSFYDSEFGPKQEAVFARAKEILEQKPWFKGVCMDNFPEECDIENIEDEATGIAFETAMWDDPNFYTSLMEQQ